HIFYSSLFYVVFFFSSRRRHTRFSRDWSSDVCSSDLDDVVVVCVNDALVAEQIAQLATSGHGCSQSDGCQETQDLFTFEAIIVFVIPYIFAHYCCSVIVVCVTDNDNS